MDAPTADNAYPIIKDMALCYVEHHPEELDNCRKFLADMQYLTLQCKEFAAMYNEYISSMPPGFVTKKKLKP